MSLLERFKASKHFDFGFIGLLIVVILVQLGRRKSVLCYILCLCQCVTVMSLK